MKLICCLFFIFPFILFAQEVKLLHSKITTSKSHEVIKLEANVINAHLVNYIIVNYKYENDVDWSQTEMNPIEGKYYAEISPDLEKGKYLSYNIDVYDANEKVITSFASKSNPQIIKIELTNEKIVEVKTIDKKKVTDEDFEIYNIEFAGTQNIKIESASKQVEPIKETPVPITIITADMIKKSGFKNLKDILVTYVPGMTFSQDHNEVNVAMRGIYASSQQKILIMRDGHRLNNRAYSEANPDYSISIDSIKHIEILRGPSSSIYGNVALTAVINIITKDYKDSELLTNIGYGNYGQKQISGVYSKKIDEKDNLTIWGNFYEADGEEHYISLEESQKYSPVYEAIDGNAIIDGFKDNPSYDFGLKYKYNGFDIYGEVRHSKYIEPFTGGGKTGEVYDYDAIDSFRGEKPGLGKTSHHFGLKYSKEVIKDLELSFEGYYDYNMIHFTLATDPRDISTTPETLNSFLNISWNEYDFGMITQLNKSYKLAGEGNFLLGVQIDSMKLFDSKQLGGANGYYTDATYYNEETGAISIQGDNVLQKGKETIYSGFGQIKHRFTNQFIVNAGFRFDYKHRHQGDAVSALSPRIAFIYLPNNLFNVKLSYSKSFVDAPYWYRYNYLPSYKGSSDLKPEYLQSIQLTPTVSLLENKLEFRSNIFYNKLEDFVYRNLEATGDEPRYENAGKLDSIGFEEEIGFIEKAYQIRANFTYQRALEAENYGVTNTEIHNIPAITSNLIIDVNPLYSVYKDLWLNVTLRYIGNQIAPWNVPNDEFDDETNEESQVFLLNLGLNVKFNKFFVDGRVNNVLNTHYSQGGSVNHPYPQAGRWIFVKVGTDF